MIRGAGGVLILLGVVSFVTGDRGPGLILVVLGALLVGAGQVLYDLMHPEESDGATYAEPYAPPARVGRQEDLCFKTEKVKYADEYEAQAAIEQNHERYWRGEVEYRLERSYLCEFCDWWHTTSQARRS